MKTVHLLLINYTACGVSREEIGPMSMSVTTDKVKVTCRTCKELS